MASEEHACPECGQPVETVVKRHKTLGAWVPVWVAGPCRNPKCEAYVDEGAEHAEEHAQQERHEKHVRHEQREEPTTKKS